LVFISQLFVAQHIAIARLSCIVHALIKFAGVLNTVVSLDFVLNLIAELPFFLSKQVSFLRACLLYSLQ
jgi:hypothetical protein